MSVMWFGCPHIDFGGSICLPTTSLTAWFYCVIKTQCSIVLAGDSGKMRKKDSKWQSAIYQCLYIVSCWFTTFDHKADMCTMEFNFDRSFTCTPSNCESSKNIREHKNLTKSDVLKSKNEQSMSEFRRRMRLDYSCFGQYFQLTAFQSLTRPSGELWNG